YATPWLEAELEDTAGVMGEDFHPYGFEKNRAQIEMFAGEAFRLGLTSRLIPPEEYFADYLASIAGPGASPRVAPRAPRRDHGRMSIRSSASWPRSPS